MISLKYCVLYPKAENVHLIKDVGMIAYKMAQLFNYDAFLACYENGDYPYIENEVKGLKLKFLEKSQGSEIRDGMAFLKKNSKDIDILQIFHMTLSSFFYAYQYKNVNPKGKLFLKLDCTPKLIEKIKKLNIFQKFVFSYILNKSDVIGIEQRKLYDEIYNLLGKNKNKLILVPNGIDYTRMDYDYEFENKKDVVLNVGRIGSGEKRTELLIKAFNSIVNEGMHNWKLVLVGPVEDDFLKSLHDIKGNIIIKGSIYDRTELYKEYSSAKLYACTSLFESFGISMLEAAAAGDVIISTDVGIASELALVGAGEVVPVDDFEAFKKSLKKYMMADDLEKYSKNAYNFCKKNFDWDDIVKNINKKLQGDIFVE